jgi:GNAT superfamily N-acetyltransferase
VRAGRDPGPLIRDARADDAAAIATLLGQLGYPVEPEAVPPRLERLAAAGDRAVVAEVDGDVVGLASLRVSQSIEYDTSAGQLASLVVDEAHRGMGVGRALVEAMEAEARARGCGAFFVTTAERRADAHAFYERLGLDHTGRRYGKLL